jgi:cysteine dioxygenase
MSVKHDRHEQSPDQGSDPDTHAAGSGDSSSDTGFRPDGDTSDPSLANDRARLLALLSDWDSLLTRIPENAIREGLEGLRLDRRALVDSINFNEQDYKRNLVHSTATYEVLVLCWRSGQRSPIHDHGDSVCGLLVLEGTATETSFELGPSGSFAMSHRRRIEAGTCVISRGSDIHQVANLEPTGIDLISLHVYSPPLSAFRTYRIDKAASLVPDHHIKVPALPISARPRAGSLKVRFDPDL